MEVGRQDEIHDVSLTAPNMGSMHMEFMSQAYLRNRSCSEIDIEAETPETNLDHPLPIFLKVVVNLRSGFKGGLTAEHGTGQSQAHTQGDNGSIGPGEILALMGPSGSGKTTLLKILGGRLHENVRGTITYNDIPYSPALKRRIGFVTQDDVLFPQLTVEETLGEKEKGPVLGMKFLLILRYYCSMNRLQALIQPLQIDSFRSFRVLLRYIIFYQFIGRKNNNHTIHQPSSRMFHTFDKVLLISEGYPVYYGKARDSLDYFSSLRFIPDIAMNPAEFLLDLATGQVLDIRVPEDLRASQGTADPERAVIKVSKVCHIGLMFYICIFWTSSSLFGAVYVFPFEKTYLVKERKADMYRLSVYYACSTLCDMLAHVFYPCLFMGIVYFMAGFKRTVSCFFMTLSAVLLVAITSQGAGEMFGAAVLSIKTAGMIASLVLMLFLLTGGYYVQHIPKFMRWMKYVSFMYYGFRLLLKVQYSGDELYDCESKGGCRSLQSSPSFDTVNLSGGLEEVWVLLAMALGYRLCAYICLRRRINACNL
ncbi:hypothetical protein C3L33_11501, partial [Rhododendron williamsianum]